MRGIIGSVCLFLANILCVAIIGFTGIQNYLSAAIYFVPIIISIIAIFAINKTNRRQNNLSFLILIGLFVTGAVVVDAVFYLKSPSWESLLAATIFVAIFDIFPLLFTMAVYNFCCATAKM